MDIKETISILKIMRSEIEWDYPMDYAAAIDTAIDILKKHIPEKHEMSIDTIICPYCGQTIKLEDLL